MSQQLPTVGALQSSAPPPFLTKTYDMVDDPATDKVVSWSSTDNSFVVWSPPEFSRDLLPKFFKHNHFSSFVRQLNIYGFRKVDPDRWEFANERFLRGQRQLLRSIHRRKPAQGHSQQHGHGPSLEVSKFGGMEGEIERLKRDKNVLMSELVRIKQQHQTTEQKLRVMGQRLHATEQRQGQMMSFLAKALQNPTFLSQLMQKSDNSKRYDSDTKKRRLQNPVNKGLGGVSGIPISEVQLMKHEVASVNEHTHSMLVELLSSSGASKRADRPFVMVDRPVAPEERVSNSEEDEFSSPGGQGEVTRKKMHVPAGAIMRSSQVAAYEREHLYDSQVQASVSAIPDDARGFEDRGLVGGECLPEMWFSCAVERFPQEDVESVVFHNVPGMNDMFCEQFLGGKLDSGDSATDADGEFSGSGSGDQDGDYAVSPQEWRINKRNRDLLGYDFERRSLFSNSMKLPVL